MYLGRQLVSGNYLKLDDLSGSFNGSTTTFNLTAGGQAFYPGSVYSILVSLSGVVQEPVTSYLIDRNQITFATAPSSTDDFFCIVLGTALGVGVPGEGTVNGSKLSQPFNYDDGVLYLDAANNRVGIGTTIPQQTLHVVGSGSTTLLVSGNARVTGILTVGSSSVTVDGNNNQVNVGTGVTITNSGFLIGSSNLHSTGLSASSINVSGVGTFASLSVSGNVSIAGTVTYDDVTNVDSIGIVTARTGVRINSGGLVVTAGVSTFSVDPVLIGSGTSTGTASQPLQVTGNTYISSGLGVGVTNNTTAGTISASNNITAGGAVYAAGASGYYSSTYVGNARNPIWRFANADGYGLSYFQGSSGVSPAGGGDTLGFHFGTATAAASLLQLNNGSGVVVNGTLGITGQFQSTQANSTADGGGQIYLNGATGNRIDFNGNGIAAPTFTTRSAGTKIVLYPGVASSAVDFGFGIENSTLWSSVGTTANQFKWYAGTTNIATLFGTGELVVGTTTKTGTSSQPLQVTGGAYISGNVGIATTNPQYTLHVVGSFAATTKSFVIDHPTKPNYKLRYASLEGPENSVYVRGRTIENVIELPDYWTGLVDENSITVNLTPIGNKNVWVEEINNNKVYINSNSTIDCFYIVFAERKDVEKLVVEIPES